MCAHSLAATLSLASIAVNLSGCGGSLFSERETNPVIQETAGTAPLFNPFQTEYVATLATTADRRLVIVAMNGPNIGKFCAEPPADALTSAVSSLSSSLKNRDAEFGAKSAVALSTSPLFIRSQSIQWQREMLSALCNGAMNHNISEPDYRTSFRTIMDHSKELLEKEFAILPKITVNYSVSPQKASLSGIDTITNSGPSSSNNTEQSP